MAIYRAQISFAYDSAFPRDRITINPHFFGDNAQALADALKNNIAAHAGVPITEHTIKIYDAEKPPPSYPLATVTAGTGQSTTTGPREIALCLSYYSTWNRKSYRGRLYIPGHWLGGSYALRPSAGQITTALGMRTLFTQNMPAQHNWVVYSPKLKLANGVTHCWVDDEWDVMRSRGLKGTSRQTATVP